MRSVESMTEFVSATGESFGAPSSAFNDEEMLITNVVKKEVESLKNNVANSTSDTKQMNIGMNATLQTLLGERSTLPGSKNGHLQNRPKSSESPRASTRAGLALRAKCALELTGPRIHAPSFLGCCRVFLQFPISVHSSDLISPIVLVR